MVEITQSDESRIAKLEGLVRDMLHNDPDDIAGQMRTAIAWRKAAFAALDEAKAEAESRYEDERKSNNALLALLAKAKFRAEEAEARIAELEAALRVWEDSIVSVGAKMDGPVYTMSNRKIAAALEATRIALAGLDENE